jgi:hypothetical protein
MHGHVVPILPTTRPGRWAVRLAIAYVVLMLAWAILPGGAGLGLACGLVGGVAALVALRRGERALTVFAAVLPLVLVVFFVAAELLIGHD